MATVLLHVCCAHCAAYCTGYWRDQGHEVSAFWYNPNIHPYQEYRNRLDAMWTVSQAQDVPLIVSSEYDAVKYFQMVKGREFERCYHCFRLRLSGTADFAHDGGFDAFTSTLLISPQQRHDLIKEVGLEVAGSTGVDFYYSDLRKQYSDSRHITKQMDIYRQQYCGCMYSEWERYVE